MEEAVVLVTPEDDIRKMINNLSYYILSMSINIFCFIYIQVEGMCTLNICRNLFESDLIFTYLFRRAVQCPSSIGTLIRGSMIIAS